MKHAGNVHSRNLGEPDRVMGEPKKLDGPIAWGWFWNYED